MTNGLALSVERLVFRYGNRAVLNEVSIGFVPGVNVLLGRNGAGKTTLIRVLAGAAAPAKGCVCVGGASLDTGARNGRAPLRRVGWLPQQFGYPRSMTVTEYVAYAAWLKELPRARLTERVEAAMDVADLANLAKEPMRALSGGQLRRVGLAAAVVADPDVLILDEPTAGLDPEQRDHFHAMIRRFRSDKVVVLATHLLEDVHALADSIIVIDEGDVLWQGSPDELARAGASGRAGVDGLRDGFRRVLGARR